MTKLGENDDYYKHHQELSWPLWREEAESQIHNDKEIRQDIWPFLSRHHTRSSQRSDRLSSSLDVMPIVRTRETEFPGRVQFITMHERGIRIPPTPPLPILWRKYSLKPEARILSSPPSQTRATSPAQKTEKERKSVPFVRTKRLVRNPKFWLRLSSRRDNKAAKRTQNLKGLLFLLSSVFIKADQLIGIKKKKLDDSLQSKND